MNMVMNSDDCNGKLVRDKIPYIIRQSGRKPVYHRASEEEYITKLLDKLVEETNEFKSSPSEEELADILEVILALSDIFGFGLDNVDDIRSSKLKDRGGFRERYILETVTHE